VQVCVRVRVRMRVRIAGANASACAGCGEGGGDGGGEVEGEFGVEGEDCCFPPEPRVPPRYSPLPPCPVSVLPRGVPPLPPSPPPLRVFSPLRVFPRAPCSPRCLPFFCAHPGVSRFRHPRCLTCEPRLHRRVPVLAAARAATYMSRRAALRLFGDHAESVAHSGRNGARHPQLGRGRGRHIHGQQKSIAHSGRDGARQPQLGR
jgi:hypothetical protein